MDNNKTVLFDPGYAPLVIDSLGQIGYTYYIFNASSNLKAKRLNFPHVMRKFENLIQTNIAFYLGCLMWAAYIKQFKDYQIEGNKLLGEVCEQKEYTGELDFLIDFLSNILPKDSKYYINKNYEAPKEYINILETYKELLILNEGFIYCDNTDKIKLPKKIKKITKENLKKIYNIIQEAIKNSDINSLQEGYKLIF